MLTVSCPMDSLDPLSKAVTMLCYKSRRLKNSGLTWSIVEYKSINQTRVFSRYKCMSMMLDNSTEQ